MDKVRGERPGKKRAPFSRSEPLMRGICDVKSHYDMMMNGKVWQLVVFNYEVFLALPVCAM